MAESGIFWGKSGTDLTALKEALNAQQQLLHKLDAELDQEREASETATSEALSMILRLQGEKAAVEMEAKQYKRMTEEKMFHADECVAIFEEVIYQKDMEIAALESQIQAYKYKLLSLGCNDIDCIEAENSESAFLQKIELLYGGVERNSVVVGSAEPPPDIDIYWKQIKKLDEKVKNVTEFVRRNRRNSLGPLHSQGSFTALNSCLDAVKKNQEIKPSKTLDVSLSSYKVQDIFEVPEVFASCIVDSKRKTESENYITGRENRLEKPDSPTVVKSLLKAKPKAGSRTEIEQLRKKVEQIEPATTGANKRTEIKELLNEIQKQLNTIQSDIRLLKTHESKKCDALSLDTIQKEMLYFWF